MPHTFMAVAADLAEGFSPVLGLAAGCVHFGDKQVRTGACDSHRPVLALAALIGLWRQDVGKRLALGESLSRVVALLP